MSYRCIGASLLAQLVNNLLAARETWAQSLCWEDPLEKGMATHSSILAWKILGSGAWQGTVHGVARVRHDLAAKPPFFMKTNRIKLSNLPLPDH